MNREEILDCVRDRTEPWDIIVIGGGATGVGCAVDAASRGLDVLQLEQHDFGKGTSSRSTKLVHGGVRYLAQGNISLVREALKERGILLKNAPNVVHKMTFVIPCYGLWHKILYGTGLKVYDLLSGRHSFGRSRILSRQETLEHLPNITGKHICGGVLYYDGQFDDTRLLIDLVMTAHEKGASVLNYAKVTAIRKDNSGQARGVEFEDAESGEKFKIGAKVIINATGAFCDSVRKMSEQDVENIVTYSQGVHLVFGRKFLPAESALMIPKTSDGRVLFMIPWYDHTLVGTTDTRIETAELEPKALTGEIDFILETAAKYLAKAPNRSDILSVFAGIRPLVKSSNSKNTASLSRGHTIVIDGSGLLTVTGGKWTTYRRMAEDAVDQAAKLAGLENKISTTADLKIHQTEMVSNRGEKLHPDLPYFEEDVTRAVRDEMARTVEDVLARRTRTLFLNAKAAIEIAPRVAELMAKESRKDKSWIAEQIQGFNHTAQDYLENV
jgi:glycerol-3-phosphate dehydrogenase